MSKLLYITADTVGLPTGGGQVTYHESRALKELGPTTVWGRRELHLDGQEPWCYDQHAVKAIGCKGRDSTPVINPVLAHGYAGTFTETVKRLKDNGCKVTWTCAAHDVDKSRAEHDKLGIPFPYDHLNIPEQFERYIGGYKLADVLITPSKHSYDVLRRQGCANRIEIIQHGCSIPRCSVCGGEGYLVDSDEPHEEVNCSECGGSGYEPVKPLPKRFTVGYLGSCTGADKGLVYLLQAWSRLKYRDGSMLVLGGRDSTHPAVRYLVQQMGCSAVYLAGWQPSLAEFYSGLSLYIQPAVTEGFGMEGLEAMAHGRLSIASEGAGCADVCLETFPTYDVESLATKIENYKINPASLEEKSQQARIASLPYSWEAIRRRYQAIWRELVGGEFASYRT